VADAAGTDVTCTCEALCPNADHCIAIYIYDEDECWILCEPDPGPGDRGEGRAALDTRVAVDTRGTTLAQAAQFLAEHCEVELLAPAERLGEVVDLSARDTTLGAVIEAAGLVVRETGRDAQGYQPAR
jgi:hypothetical protein